MNAIRRDEMLDNLHSVYVDQWDWEKIITPETRNVETLKHTVRQIVKAIKGHRTVWRKPFRRSKAFISTDVTFFTTQELEDRYPDLTPKQREDAVCKEHKTVFLMQIGGVLKSGAKARRARSGL